MNQNSQESHENKRGFHIPHAVTLGALVLVIFFNIGELLRTPRVEEVIKDQSMFSIPAEMSARYVSCNYQYLFFCGERTSSIPAECTRLTGLAEVNCILANDDRIGSGSAETSGWRSVAFINTAVAAVVILPRLPDATIHILRDRWNRGSLAFSVALVFVVAYMTLMVVALRSESSAKLWIFACVVVGGPYLIGGVFWLLQHALAGASAGAEKFVALMVSSFGLSGCLLICINHDMKSLSKVIRGVH